MAVRMVDIARDLGVSKVTVWKVFHGHPDISEETRKRVLEHAKKLNSPPKTLSRGERLDQISDRGSSFHPAADPKHNLSHSRKANRASEGRIKR